MTGHGENVGVQQAQPAEMQHHFRHSAGEERADGRMIDGAVRQDADEARHTAVDVDPIVDGRSPKPSGVGDGGDVEQEIGGTAKGRMDDHRVADAGVGDDVAAEDPPGFEFDQGLRGTHGEIGPDGFSRRREGAVRKGKPEGFTDDLRRRRSAEELAAAAGRTARAAAEVGRFLEREQPMRIARADRLNGPEVFAVGRRQGDSAGNKRDGQITHSGQRHHHRGKALVAGGDAENARPAGQGSGKAPEDLRGVVPVGQAVEHAGGSLCPAVAGIRAEGRERNRFQLPELFGCRLHEQADLPVARVVAECDGFSIGRTHAALGAEDEILFPADFLGIPAHADVLRQAEEVAARAVQQHVGVQREASLRPRRPGADAVDLGIVRE